MRVSRLASLEMIRGKNSVAKTVVKGLRAEQSFFDRCDLVAKAEGVDRNKLIVRVMSEYLDKDEWEKASIVMTLSDEFVSEAIKERTKGRKIRW